MSGRGVRITRRAMLAAAATLLPAAAYAAEQKKKGGGLSFIQFPTMTATTRRASGRRGVLSVEGGLDVGDPVLRTRADQSQPILRDGYMRWLSAYAASLAPQQPPDPDEIGRELQRITDRVLGRPGARFLIGTVMLD